MSRQVIWTTKMVEEATEKLNNGFVLSRVDNPFFEKVIGLRKDAITFMMSPEEQEEYIKCALDIHYFASTYCYIKGEEGQPIIIPLRDYQKEILDNFFNNRFNILMASRQIGKTICSSIMMLHYVLFNNNKNVLVTANKLDTAVEVLDKVREIYQRLPFFLQQGIVNWNQKFMVFENKSRIKGFATTKTSSIGQTADFLYLDEFAYLPDNIADKFYKSVFPTVSNIENSKIIITSTPNGFNLFHKLLTEAEKPEGEKSSY
jgi:phage terminase large subunit-like protein